MIVSMIAAALHLVGPALGPATWCTASLYDWSRDGSAVVWSVALCDASSGPKYLMVTDAAGHLKTLFRDGLLDEVDAPDAELETPSGFLPRKMPWIEDAASAGGDYAGWAHAHPLRGGPAGHHRTSSEAEFGSGKDRVQFRMRSAGEGCTPLSLRLSLGREFIDVAQDRCLPGEPNHRSAEGFVTMAWSPDGDRLAIAWGIRRFTTNDQASSGFPVGMLTRGYTAVIPRAALEGKEPFRTVKRALCPVDLLDARTGEGAGLEALAGKLMEAGFTIGHRGKAGTPRKATEVYYAPGFAPEAREAAALAGVKQDEVEGAVKPLTWKSPHPITIAVGAVR